MLPLSLSPYRMPINGSTVATTAGEILKQAATAEALQQALEWPEMHDILAHGFAPDKNAGELIPLLKGSIRREKMKAVRIKRGFPDFLTPRKGLIGWWQRTFCDPRELKLPTGLDILTHLQNSARFALLIQIHDAILMRLSVAEPKKVPLEEVIHFPNPVGEMIQTGDLVRAARLVKALKAPLKKVDPNVIVDDLAGYVASYQTKRSFAYFYS